MDATLEGSEQLHRVKRGRPAKAAPVVIESVAETVARMKYTDAVNYALRVWAGQSIDLPLSERKERVLNALRGQSLPADGLTFTAEGIA